MIFIHPMWDTETQRLGLKTCTPFGYFLRELADGIGYLGLFIFLATPIYILYRIFAHRFAWHLCWGFLIAILVGIIGRVVYEFSWRVAVKKQFRYDSERGIVSWIEAGHERFYPDRP